MNPMKQLIRSLICAFFAIVPVWLLSACSQFGALPPSGTLDVQASSGSAELRPGTYEISEASLNKGTRNSVVGAMYKNMRRDVVNALREHGFTEAAVPGSGEYRITYRFAYTFDRSNPGNSQQISIFLFSVFKKDGGSGEPLWRVQSSCRSSSEEYSPLAFADILIAGALAEFNTWLSGQVECKNILPFYKKIVK